MKRILLLVGVLELIAGILIVYKAAAVSQKPAQLPPAAEIITHAEVPPNQPTSSQDALSREQFRELMKLRGQVGILRRQLEELQTQLGMKNRAEQSTPPGIATTAGQLSNKYYPATSWANLGYAAPEATAMTFFWALRQGDQSAYSGALGKEMPPIGEDWVKAFQGVKGSYISGLEQSPDGELVVNITHEGSNGEMLNTFINYRQENGQWLIKNLTGFPIQMLAPVPIQRGPQYSTPANK